MIINQIILILYLFSILLLGLRYGEKVHSIKDFAISNTSYGTFVIFATLSASFIGGGFSTGNASKVFLYGIGNIVAMWGFSIKQIFIGKYIVPNIDKYKGVISTGGIIKKAYGAGAQIITGIFSVILCSGVLAAQVGAIGDIFYVFLNIPEIYGILIGCSIVIIYSTVGGMGAIVATDVMQFILLSIGIPLVFIYGINEIGGIEKFTTVVPAEYFNIFYGKSIKSFICLFLTFLIGETLIPPYVQRLLIGKNIKHTARGTIISGVYSIIFFTITGLIGLIALVLNSQINPNLAMPFVIKMVMPIGLSGFVISGMVAVVLSSADSVLNSAAIGFVIDFIEPVTKILGIKISNRNKLKLARIMNVFTGIFSVIIAIKIPNILDILIFAYKFWSPVILVPLTTALLGLRVKTKSFYAGAFTGVILTLAWDYLLFKPFNLDGIIIGTFSNLCIYLIINYTGNKKKCIH